MFTTIAAITVGRLLAVMITCLVGVFLLHLIGSMLWSILVWFVGLFLPPAPQDPPYRPPTPDPPARFEPGPPAEQVDVGYPSNWATIARTAKINKNWRCQRCGLSLLSDKNLLHVHHSDRNPQNNSDWNLQVLCVQCHSLEDGPGHKRLAGAIKTDGRLARILALRRQQSS